MMKRLLLASTLLLPISAHADETIQFPYCADMERLHHFCSFELDGLPPVHLSPAEWAQMQRLNDQAYQILMRASDRNDHCVWTGQSKGMQCN
jgi:hypothetical protein